MSFSSQTHYQSDERFYIPFCRIKNVYNIQIIYPSCNPFQFKRTHEKSINILYNTPKHSKKSIDNFKTRDTGGVDIQMDGGGGGISPMHVNRFFGLTMQILKIKIITIHYNIIYTSNCKKFGWLFFKKLYNCFTYS